jgi:hypothetical protein
VLHQTGEPDVLPDDFAEGEVDASNGLPHLLRV